MKTITFEGIHVHDGISVTERGWKLADMMFGAVFDTVIHIPKSEAGKYFISLDAYRDIWGKLSHRQQFSYAQVLSQLTDNYDCDTCEEQLCVAEVEPCIQADTLFAEPHHHLEALARILQMNCPECNGHGRLPITPRGELPSDHDRDCPHCEKGKVTVLDAWRIK